MSQPSRPKSPDDQTAIYIRVKRNKTTYFLQCVPSETILQIKEKLQELIDQSVGDQRLILMPNREVLDDSKSLADQKVENDAVVALTLRKDDNEFEEQQQHGHQALFKTTIEKMADEFKQLLTSEVEESEYGRHLREESNRMG